MMYCTLHRCDVWIQTGVTKVYIRAPAGRPSNDSDWSMSDWTRLSIPSRPRRLRRPSVKFSVKSKTSSNKHFTASMTVRMLAQPSQGWQKRYELSNKAGSNSVDSAKISRKDLLALTKFFNPV